MGVLQLHAVSRTGTYHIYTVDDWDYLQSQADNLFAEIWMVEARSTRKKNERILIWSQEL